MEVYCPDQERVVPGGRETELAIAFRASAT
jgi:hypothetical protein